MKILAANLLPMALLAATIWFVGIGHEGFAIATLIGCALTAHTFSGKDA